jgi:hypothetical protein
VTSDEKMEDEIKNTNTDSADLCSRHSALLELVGEGEFKNKNKSIRFHNRAKR